MIFTRILGDLKVETEDCSPGGLESCRDRWTVDMHPLAADELGACKRSLQQGNSSPMAKQRKAIESCCEGFEGFEAFEGFKGC